VLETVSRKVVKKFKFAERMSIFFLYALHVPYFLVQIVQVGTRLHVPRKERESARVALLTFQESCATETAGRRVRPS